MEDWAEIRRLHRAEGMPIKAIVRRLGVSRMRVVQCRPADPEAKGLVERANRYLETSFLPGRTFASPADFTAQLDTWLQRGTAGRRVPVSARPQGAAESGGFGMGHAGNQR